MGLFTKALIFGAGYALGHPQGRRQLVQAREQASRLAQNPRVVRAREHAWDVAGDQALAVKNRSPGPSSVARPTAARPRWAPPAAARSMLSPPSRRARAAQHRHRGGHGRGGDGSRGRRCAGLPRARPADAARPARRPALIEGRRTSSSGTAARSSTAQRAETHARAPMARGEVGGEGVLP